MFPPSRMSHASIDAKTRAERRMPEDLIRLCVGIEEYPPSRRFLFPSSTNASLASET